MFVQQHLLPILEDIRRLAATGDTSNWRESLEVTVRWRVA